MKTEQEIKDWINSDEGRKAIKDTAESAEADIEIFREARRIDPATLNEPMTI